MLFIVCEEPNPSTAPTRAEPPTNHSVGNSKIEKSSVAVKKRVITELCLVKLSLVYL